MGIGDLLKGFGDALRVALASRLPRNQHLKKLVEAYRGGHLVFVLGAGVSVEHGLPDWNTLLQKLLLSTLQTDSRTPKESTRLAELFNRVFAPDPLIAARYLYNYYCRNFPDDPLAFCKAIHKAIYESIDFDKETDLLKEIRQFCAAAGRSPNIDSIISYNYDDLLETYLRRVPLEIPFHPAFSANSADKSEDLLIYHTHGFLPQGGVLSAENNVTLSDKAYHEQYADYYGWSNLVQIEKFRNHTCLFIGVSLTDPNTRRLLDIARSFHADGEIRHYHIRKHHDLPEIQRKLKSIEEANLPADKRTTKSELSSRAKELALLMEKFEEDDATSFGLGTLWVDRYDEIPALLGTIRRMDVEPAKAAPSGTKTTSPGRDGAVAKRSKKPGRRAGAVPRGQQPKGSTPRRQPSKDPIPGATGPESSTTASTAARGGPDPRRSPARGRRTRGSPPPSRAARG
jgi:hypothetical protein